jgi:F-type H+-transporting ATPase subunit a
MAATLHISISAEKVLSIADFPITNSMLTSLVASGLILAFALWVRLTLKKTSKPTGVQNLAEMIVDALHNLVQSVTENNKKTMLFFPLIASFFLFILVNNWIGLIPGVGTIGFYEKESPKIVESTPSVETPAQSDSTPTPAQAEQAAATTPLFVPYFRAGTADINMTLALALLSVAMIQFFGVYYLKLSYFTKFINFSNPLNFVVGILEIVSEFSRIISFAFRLFGNIFAGEVLLSVIGFLIPVVAPMPFYGMEIFVGFIQALVFAMLSLVLFNIATVGHGGEHH